MPRITFSHGRIAVDAADGDWMYDVADGARSGIPFACKAGACGSCATEVLAGMETLGAPGARELRTLEAQSLDPARFRLPCLADVHGDVVFGKPVRVPDAEEHGKALELLVESFRPLTLSVAEVRFFVHDPDFTFKPGQYVTLVVPAADRIVRRSYSISTPPSDRRHIEVCVRAVAGGAGSNFVHQLRPGAHVRVEGPFGDFVLREDSRKKILMIGTGTGISPLKSMLLHLLDARSRRKVRLFFGVRYDADLIYTDLLRGLAAHYPEFQYEIILSAPDPHRWAGGRGRVTDLVERLVDPDDAEDTEVYLCGSQDMIESTRRILAAKGFPDDALFHENFY